MMCLIDSICIYPQPLGDLVELEPVDVAELEHLAAARGKLREQGGEIVGVLERLERIGRLLLEPLRHREVAALAEEVLDRPGNDVVEGGAEADWIGLAGLQFAQDPLKNPLDDVLGVGLVSDRSPAAAAHLLEVGREQPAVLAGLEQLCVGPVAGRVGR
jgi:hypothetical protein